MPARYLGFAGFGAACGVGMALGFPIDAEPFSEGLVIGGSVALFVGLLVVQIREGILALRQSAGPARPVLLSSVALCAGAIAAGGIVLITADALGAFDVINHGGPWHWGPRLAAFLAETVLIWAAWTGVVVVVVVAAVQRVRARRLRLRQTG